MNFLYPEINVSTHEIINSEGISIEYPSTKFFSSKTDYNIDLEERVVTVALIRENVGYKSLWSLVKCINKDFEEESFYEKEFYILSANLTNFGNKENYQVEYKEESTADINSAEIDPSLQEIFVPYVDKKNGLLSVRIQIDFDKILDMMIFKRVLEECFFEGAKVLLSSRGYSATDSIVYGLQKKYYTFCYINDDLDLTANRACEPLTFTVSIPLNFFDLAILPKEPDAPEVKPDFIIEFTNKNFVTKVDGIIQALASRAGDVRKVQWPSKIFDTYQTDMEISSMRAFAESTNFLFSCLGFPINALKDTLTTYELGFVETFMKPTGFLKPTGPDGSYVFDFAENPLGALPGAEVHTSPDDIPKTLELVSGKIKTTINGKEIEANFSQAIISQFKLSGQFNNPRSIFYLKNADKIPGDALVKDIIQFIEENVKYPKAKLIDQDVDTSAGKVPAEIAGAFRMSFAADSEACLTIGDIIGGVDAASNLFADLADLGSGYFKYFIGNDDATKLDYNEPSKKYFAAWQNIKTYKEQFKTDSWSGIPTAVLNLPKYKQVKDEENYGWSEGISEYYAENGANQFTKEPGADWLLGGLGFLMDRLDFHEIAITQIYCALKGVTGVSEQTAREVAEITANLPEEVVSVLERLKVAKSLSGWRWFNYIFLDFANSKFGNIPIYCNDEFTHLMKEIIKWIKFGSRAIKATMKLVQDLDSAFSQIVNGAAQVRNPYDAIKKVLIKQVIKSAGDILFDILNTLLTRYCEVPGFDPPADNFADPFNTHPPENRFGLDENNNKNKVREAKKEALEESLGQDLKELVVGDDIEFVVDIIQEYISLLRCVLSPKESVELLKGEPSERALVIAKNLIRQKFSKYPKDLTYLLIGDKLILFFKKLGNKVDKSVLDSIEDYYDLAELKTGMKFNDLCSDEEKRAITDLMNNKLPKDLNILEKREKRRIAQARKILDLVQNPEKQLKISALCPEEDDDELNKFKENLIEDYASSITSVFDNALDRFNEEASTSPRSFIEEKHLFRVNSDDEIFSDYTYFTYNSCLYLNLLDSSNYIENSKKFIYKIKDRLPLTNRQMGDALIGFQKQEASLDRCSSKEGEFIDDARFAQFLNDGRIVFEFRKKKRKFSGDKYEFDVPKYMNEQEQNILKYIKEKKTILLISVEPDDDEKVNNEQYSQYSGWPSGGVRVFLRHLYYDYGILSEAGTPVFRLLYQAEFEEPKPDDVGEEVRRKDENRRTFISTLQNFTGNSHSWIGTLPGVSRKGEDFRFLFPDQPDSEFKPESFFEYDKKYYENKVKILTKDFSDENYTFYDRRDNFYILGGDFLNLKDLKPMKQDDPNFSEERSTDEIPKRVAVFRTGLEDPFTVISVVQETFLQTADQLQQIDTYETVVNAMDAYEKIGLFNLEYVYDTATKKQVRKFNVTTTDLDGKTLKNVPFISAEFYERGGVDNPVIQNNFSPALTIDFLKKIGKYLKLNYFRSTSMELYSLLDQEEVTGNLITGYATPEALEIYPEVEFKYKKQNWWLRFLGIDTSKPPERNPAKFYDYLKDESLDMIKRTASSGEPYRDLPNENYNKMKILDYSSVQAYKQCGFLPHYLNLEYFKNRVMNEAKETLCDDNLREVPIEMLDDILVNLTIRTYVTDIFVKAVPYLNTLSSDDLLNLWKDDLIVDFAREVLRQEMHQFSQYPLDEPEDYYPAFLKQKIIPVYKKYKKPDAINKINPVFDIDSAENKNKEINYFIRKEINHCIKFFIKKSVIIPATSSLYMAYYNMPDKDKFGFVSSSAEDYKYFIQKEYYTLLYYFVMSCTVDSAKRALFAGTKDELAKIFFSLRKLQGDDAYEEENPKDIVKFLNKLGFSPMPSAFSKSEWWQGATTVFKYLKMFLVAVFDSVHHILQTTSMYSDLNILITRLINMGVTIVQSFSWAFVEPETKRKIINEAALRYKWHDYIFYQRLEQSLPITCFPVVPYVVISADVTVAAITSIFIPPTTLIAAFYLIMDTIKEAAWGVDTTIEYYELGDSLRAQKEEECLIEATDITGECTPDVKQQLINDFNEMET